MAEITAAQVKSLREKTGAGMMDCKKALNESGGDLEAATDWLRKKGLSAAAKKSGRVAAEGLIGILVEGGKGAVVEVNSETDFVARNEAFQGFVRQVSATALVTDDDVEALKAAAYADSGRSVGEELTEMIATIGENMDVRRAAVLSVGKGVIASYAHSSIASGTGRIGVLVALESEGDVDKLIVLGKQLAMHVAASDPQAVSTDQLDPAVVSRERKILKEQAMASGKPPEIAEKMVEGRLRKFYEEIVLLEQTFVIDTEKKVGQAIEAAAGEIGAGVEITGFVRFALGEGIERKEDDFVAEVAELAGNKAEDTEGDADRS
ncbi:MAG: translation elongation factor Ts [Alphaproteobacteria bacterium]|nr:translation elongation factor Ts [Alphaproteobacteria bacterium]